MFISIIINTNNQNDFLERAILSCLKQNYHNYEIIIANLSKHKDVNIENRFKKNPKINFLNLKEKYLYPTQNQLYAIQQGLKYSKGKYVLLLDGDDYFAKNKLNYIASNIKKKKLVMDFPIIFDEYTNKKIKKIKTNPLKENIFYKLFINNWPGISCTSGISVERKFINNFFRKNNPFIWKNLAIDIQLSIYTKLKHDIYYIKENLTYKSDNFKNLDKIYTNYFFKKFWIRRKEQHCFNLNINKNKKFKGIDFYLTKLVLFLINKFS
jgi:glycosyltransferase involved in cell wall biosynthesis